MDLKRLAGLQDHHGHHRLDPPRFGLAEDRRLGHLRVGEEHLLDLRLATFSQPVLIISFLRSTT